MCMLDDHLASMNLTHSLYVLASDTYVMKLFDRSVDLAQFDESSPLYPICRAWMKNHPHSRGVASDEHSMGLELPIPAEDVSYYMLVHDNMYRKLPCGGGGGGGLWIYTTKGELSSKCAEFLAM